jgi:hypothetical protein
MDTILKNQILNSRKKKIPPAGGTMFLFSYARMLFFRTKDYRDFSSSWICFLFGYGF